MKNRISQTSQSDQMQKPRKAFPFASWKKHFETLEVVNKFEDIRQELAKTFDDPLTNSSKSLAQLIYDIIIFQEKTFGLEVQHFIFRKIKKTQPFFINAFRDLTCVLI